ncbi:hypothetical protein [Pandoraea pnomenusa]|uniref:hypothetical protein n=1 Tax=Pandoraea pnomenusa TaxID=93220 RepID=UPI00242D56B3|nr:hypothetical protein [Pandoraea pnomenusa]
MRLANASMQTQFDVVSQGGACCPAIEAGGPVDRVVRPASVDAERNFAGGVARRGDRYDLWYST